MSDAATEDRKAVVLARIDRLKKLLEEEAPDILLEDAHKEIGLSLEALAHAGRAEAGESPPVL